jgi:hypothetical protein
MKCPFWARAKNEELERGEGEERLGEDEEKEKRQEEQRRAKENKEEEERDRDELKKDIKAGKITRGLKLVVEPVPPSAHSSK